MQEIPKLFWAAPHLLGDNTPEMVDHGPCPRCNAERKTYKGQPAVPPGIPADFCELCYHYVILGNRILSDDTYEMYELNCRILFKGTYEDCLRYVQDKKKGRV